MLWCHVSGQRHTWSQSSFARGSCVKSLQRTCKAWMQLQIPLKAFACVSRHQSLTRDLNSCLIWQKKKINTLLPVIMSPAGNFHIYLFYFLNPSFFLQPVFSVPRLKINVGVSNQFGAASCKSKHDVCVHYMMELNQNIYRSHILRAFGSWHCSAVGCEGYLERPAGDCKHLNVYKAFSSYIQTPSSLSHTHASLWSAGSELSIMKGGL